MPVVAPVAVAAAVVVAAAFSFETIAQTAFSAPVGVLYSIYRN